MIVVNQDGTQHHYARVGGEMMPLAPIHNPAYVAESDPMETLAADVAYWVQSLSEIGDPPEMVMREDEQLWWQRDNIIVPYHTGESIEEVALRMIGPPPNKELSGDQYAELLIAHEKEFEEFIAYLEVLNPEYEGSGIMSIPLPGWTIEAGSFSFGTRTLFRSLDKTSPEQWWEELTPVEQKIEMALTATANARKDIANLDNLYPLDRILNWVEKNGELIEKYANAARIPPRILKANLAPEFLYDYSWSSYLQDTLVRDRDWVFDHPRAWSSTGVSNVHFATLSEAYNYIDVRLPDGAEHPWNSDPNAADLSSFPDITATQDEVEAYAKAFYEPKGRWPEEGFEGLELHQQDTMRFLASEANYHRLTFDQQYAVARYLATDEGAINAASIVVGMYLDRYIASNWEDATNYRAIAENLSPEDVARIWGRYRSTFEPFAYEELGPNAHLALPLAEHYLDQN